MDNYKQSAFPPNLEKMKICGRLEGNPDSRREFQNFKSFLGGNAGLIQRAFPPALEKIKICGRLEGNPDSRREFQNLKSFLGGNAGLIQRAFQCVSVSQKKYRG